MDHVSAHLCFRLLERLDPFRTWWILAVYAPLIVATAAAITMLQSAQASERDAFEAIMSIAALATACLAFIPTVVRVLMDLTLRPPSDVELSAAFTDKLRSKIVRRFAAKEMARRKEGAGADAWALEWAERAKAL